ncbi:FAD-dependent oxidoreductase [Streptomyces ficellus]|uniref:FAD-dependent oxidoreductase n=1 Tax=Streptomyces ficellus TaxID=1977088 RepID=A0ABT7Z7B8_9ACTN|nr:FAD-dependent oxidoreductase [Streptomyces ficellus]MDN3295395.1 FAD-dependent oxidoreductase [Streptomyces ficellus]
MGPRGVVVVGAGQGGLDTAAALRGRGYTGRITLVGDEPVVPYQRPPLSKGFLTGAMTAGELELRPRSFFAAHDIELVSGNRAAKIDREGRTVLLESGTSLPYDRLVLATGARPRTLPVPGAAALSGVLTLRGLADAERLRERLTGPPRRLVVVGAGFIGLELAATARKLGHEVTVVEAQARALARALTPVMSARLVAEHLDAGVRVLLSREVTALWGDSSGRVEVVELDGGERVPADLVVVGVGVLPNTELAAAAGLQVGDGVIVDAHLRTDDPDIHALGDCARFPSPHAGRHVRLESVQNASGQAACVAAAICGEPVAYTAVPWFWSEQYALRLQIAGLTAGHDETVVVGDPDGGRFSVFCFREGRLTGVESVNRPADHGIARRLLATGSDLAPDEVRRPGFDLKTHVHTPRERLSHA